MEPRTYHAPSDEPAGRLTVPDGPGLGAMVGRQEGLAARPDLATVWDGADAAFPVRITRSFWDRSTPADADDPLARQFLPDPRELVAATGDLDDPVGDTTASPVPWVVRKHPDRLLLLVTKRCHLYCRYCFRRNVEPGDSEDPTDAEWERALAYVRSSGVREVILSGGDPLAVRDARLFDTIDRLRPAVPCVRIHTRAPITLPARVTPALASGLRERVPVWVIVHCNHARELAPDVDVAFARLVDAGIPVLNQAVLLRGVNDDVGVLAELCEALVRRRVAPYYLHATDPATGNAHFRVPLERGLALHEALRERIGGIALPEYVVDRSDGRGKVRVADFLSER